MTAHIEFWMKAAPLIAVTGNHPFLIAIVDGTLHLDSFKYYIWQNALFQDDYADCLRALSLKSGINKAVAERLEAFAVGIEEANFSFHNSVSQKGAISAENTEQMPHTFLYTEFIKRVVETRSPADGLVVLLPCFWLYANAGNAMLKLRTQLGTGAFAEGRPQQLLQSICHLLETNPLHLQSVTRLPQYDAFIDKYGSEKFARESKEFMIITDTACRDVDGTIAQETNKLFVTACKYERMLWD